VYPSNKIDGEGLYTLDNFELPDNLAGLFRYLIDNKKLVNVKNADTKNLHIISDQVLEMIKTGEEGWEQMVPRKVSEAIKDKCLFDYPCDPEKKEQLRQSENATKA